MITLFLALTSGVAYGVSDFVGGVASRRVPVLQVVLVSYPVSALIVGIAAPILGGEPSIASLLWGGASGAVMAVAIWCFYSALASGPMSIVSPLTAVLVAAIPVFAGLSFGERPGALSFVGIGVSIAAVLLVSREPSTPRDTIRRFTSRVGWLTVGAGLSFALSFIFTDQIRSGTGLWPLFVARSVATVIVLVATSATKSLQMPSGNALRLAVAVGVLDVIANVAMLYAFQSGLLSIGSALISLYPAITVGLAVLLLRERISVWQVGGLVLAGAAIVVISTAQ